MSLLPLLLVAFLVLLLLLVLHLIYMYYYDIHNGREVCFVHWFLDRYPVCFYYRHFYEYIEYHYTDGISVIHGLLTLALLLVPMISYVCYYKFYYSSTETAPVDTEAAPSP
ncbi:hypothetical protein LSAT2_007998 [Lamellibrachia satsuma]|nr:hypothetical protein LSAT2_007998 [Lamellibrachia satsuma]